jgi:hypothetical protein
MWVAFPPEPASEEHPIGGDQGRDAKAAVLGAAALGAGALATGLSEDEAGSAPSAETPPELKFFMDGELDETPSEDEDLVTDEINLDELDQLLSEEGDAVSGPRPAEDFKTEELDLADLEKMLDMEGGVSPADASSEKESRSLDAPGRIDADEHLEEDLDAGSLEKEDSVIEELDLDLEDLENLLDEDTGLGDEIASVEEITGAGRPIAEESATDDADVDEIALDMAPEMENLLEEDGGGPFVEETEDLGDEALESVRASSEASTAKDTEEDQDFDFELAPGLDGIFDEGEDLEAPIEETEELDFSELGADLEAVDQTEPSEEDDLELDLDMDQAPAGGLSDEAEDLADLELDLDSDTAGEASAEEAAPELDLSALSQALGEEPGTAGSDEAAAAEDELDLEMDLGDDEAPGTEELDLELDDVDQAGVSSAQRSLSDDLPEETRELGTDELEALLESADDGADQEAEPSSDSLELDIDLDGLEAGGEDELDDATRELDLDDIEKILEMDTGEEKAGPEAENASEDLDLELDMDSIAPPPAGTEETGEDTTDADDALDLSELEKMLDVEDTTDSPTSADEDLDDLDLDFDLQPTSDENDDLDLEFDMMDEEPEEASALFDTSESEDLGLDIEGGDAEKSSDDFESDLDFEIMDEDLGVEDVDLDIEAEEIGAETLSEPTARRAGKAAGQPSHRDLTQELMDEMAAADTQTMAAPPMETKPIKPAPPPVKRRKKSSKSLVLLLILVLLGGGAYLLPKYTDIKLPAIKMPDLSGIPFIGDFFTPATSEAIVPVGPSLTGDWVQNQRAGRLYTIQGKVRNEYQKPRSFIRVTGRVYANGRQFQRAATAYCGNVLTAEQLATLPLADIQKTLSNRSGADNVNVNVGPGQEVPFLVVFGDLPPDVELQEFAVEISGSLPVAGDQ